MDFQCYHRSAEDTGLCIYLAGDDGLHEEAEHGEHSQTAVLDLLHLCTGNTTVSLTNGCQRYYTQQQGNNNRYSVL